MVIVVLSDTHRRVGNGLQGRAARAVAQADRVIHAGDFTTGAVLEAHRESAQRLDAVHGNRDDTDVCEAVPSERVLTIGDVTVAVTHRREGGETGLAMWGRSRGAALVVSGHTHQPSVRDTGDVVLLNPGSHTQPRGGPASHAEIEVTSTGLRGTIRTRADDQLTKLSVRADPEKTE